MEQQLESTLKEEEKGTINKGEQDSDIGEVQKVIIKEEEEENILPDEQQVIGEEEQVINIKEEEQEVTIKEEEQELSVTVWNSLHEDTLLLVKVESPDIIKEETSSDTSETQDTQTIGSALQEDVNEPLNPICLTLKSKPSHVSKLCLSRKMPETEVDFEDISGLAPGRNPAEIEVCMDSFEDSSGTMKNSLGSEISPSEKKCRKRTAGSDLMSEKSPKDKKKGSQCSFEASAETTDIFEQDNAEKEIGSSEMSVSNRRKFALSVLRDQCLKVITQWYMGQPFSEIVNNMNLNPDSVRHIVHVWCTEKRLACHKPGQGRFKGKLRTRKGQVPTLWKWRFLVTVGKNSTLQCMVCDKRLNSAKMDNITLHIRNWHPYSAELPHRVRRAIHQAWKRRQKGLNKLQELQASCTDKREITSLPNEPDKMTSLSPSIQQNALQEPEHCSHVQEIKNTFDDSRLCNQTKDYSAQHVANNEEKRESDTQNDTVQSNETKMQQKTGKKQRQIRYFQDQWRQKYLVDYDWKAEEVVCLVCGLRMRCLRSCTFERHATRRHPESIHYSEETRNALWESWNKGQHSFPLLNTGSGMSDFKGCSKGMEGQPSMIKHHDSGLQQNQASLGNRTVKCKVRKSEGVHGGLASMSHSMQQNDAGLQESLGDCMEELGITRLQAMLDKSSPVVQQNNRPASQQKTQKTKSGIRNRLYNQIEEYIAQNEPPYEDKDSLCTQADIQYIWSTNRQQNDAPQKKPKYRRHFLERWRQKYLVDYDWKTEEAICILCGLHMRSLRTCSFERHAKHHHPESLQYSEENREALWNSWYRGEYIYPLRHTKGSISNTTVYQDEAESRPDWHMNHQSSENRLYNQIDHTGHYLRNEDEEHDAYSKQPDMQHTHRQQNDMSQVLQNKQKHIRSFQDYWRQKYLVDYDWKREEAVCILCGLHMRSLRNCTLKRHVQRRHPESVHYPEKTREALWKAWNKGEYLERQPSWHKNIQLKINTEAYMALQQEQIESVLKSTDVQH